MDNKKKLPSAWVVQCNLPNSTWHIVGGYLRNLFGRPLGFKTIGKYYGVFSDGELISQFVKPIRIQELTIEEAAEMIENMQEEESTKSKPLPPAPDAEPVPFQFGELIEVRSDASDIWHKRYFLCKVPKGFNPFIVSGANPLDNWNQLNWLRGSPENNQSNI